MPTPGVVGFTRTMYRDALIFDDLKFTGRPYPISIASEPGPAQLKMMDGSVVTQRTWHGPDRPMSVRAMAFSLSYLMRIEDEYLQLREVVAREEPINFWPEIMIEDAWHIPGATTGQTVWKTSRVMAYGWQGITHANHPPEAFIDGTAQTVITSGTPTAGQVLVPTAEGSKTITTPALSAGTHLRLRYWPRFQVTFATWAEDHADYNLLRLNLELAEAPV